MNDIARSLRLLAKANNSVKRKLWKAEKLNRQYYRKLDSGSPAVLSDGDPAPGEPESEIGDPAPGAGRR